MWKRTWGVGTIQFLHIQLDSQQSAAYFTVHSHEINCRMKSRSKKLRQIIPGVRCALSTCSMWVCSDAGDSKIVNTDNENSMFWSYIRRTFSMKTVAECVNRATQSCMEQGRTWGEAQRCGCQTQAAISKYRKHLATITSFILFSLSGSRRHDSHDFAQFYICSNISRNIFISTI